MQFLCSARKWTSIIRVTRLGKLQLLKINCKTTNDQQKEDVLMNKEGKISPNQASVLEIMSTLTTKLNRKQTTLLQVQAWKMTEW